MTVFENIKNLIRHGANHNSNSASSANPSSHDTPSATTSPSLNPSLNSTLNSLNPNTQLPVHPPPPPPSQQQPPPPPSSSSSSSSPLYASPSPLSMLSASPPSRAAPPVVTTSTVSGLTNSSAPADPPSSSSPASASISPVSTHHTLSPVASATTHDHRHSSASAVALAAAAAAAAANTSSHTHTSHTNTSSSSAAPSSAGSASSAVSSSSSSSSASAAARRKHGARYANQHPAYAGLGMRYKLVEKMGDGAFSVVYKALDTLTGDNVAVKVVHKQSLSSSQRSSILKEVAIMRQLRHKNIVELQDFIESSDYYFIILELIPGGELFHQIVRLTYFSEELSRHVILQVAHAIRYLHEEAGVVHRDIKPENLLFSPAPFIASPIKQVRAGEDAEAKQDEGVYIPGVGAGGIGTIKLADFGLSKIIWDANTMTPCGTVGYTAPEIVNDQRYSKSVDMWALGCVLYTILCGFPPFYDENIQVLTEKVARGEYTFLSPWWDEISKGAKDLVSHLLTVDPKRRYTIEQFLAHPWITQSNASTVPAVDSPLLKPAGGAAGIVSPGVPLHQQPPPATDAQQIEKLVAEEAAINQAAAQAAHNAGSTPAAPLGSSYFAGIIGNSVASPDTEKTATNTLLNTTIPEEAEARVSHAAGTAAVASPPAFEEHPTAGIVVPEGLAPGKAYMSPAVVAMKEAFDVFNAVHRLEEENATQQRARGVRGSGGAKSVLAKKKLAQTAAFNSMAGYLGEVGEEEEEEEEEVAVEQELVGEMRGLSVTAPDAATAAPASAPGSAGSDDDGSKFFELSLEGSTLIERRKRASSSGSVSALGSSSHSSSGIFSMTPVTGGGSNEGSGSNKPASK